MTIQSTKKDPFRPKVLVIGLDGATWNLIMPWVDQGKLPTIERLNTDGCWGELKGTILFIVSPASKCYLTGKNPDIATAVYPSFPADMQPVKTPMLAVASGKAQLKKQCFDSRFNHVLN